jgi:hypothetical protein
MDTTNLPLKIMKRYNEFTEEEIEDLARECDRMAEENSRLRDLNAELLAALEAKAAVSLPLDCVKAAIGKAQDAR